jgi:transposase
MRDTELYRQLLGLEAPWTVARVELDVKALRVDVHAEHVEGHQFDCPVCGRALAVYDHAAERSWRHLDSMQFKTFLHARPPRVECPEHGVRQVKLAWAEPRARFTALFERLCIDILRETSITGATRILGISWDEAWHVLDRAVERGRARKQTRPVAKLGVDEKAIARGHTYLTLVCDIEAGTVEHVAEGRKEASLDTYFEQLPPEARERIEAVAVDMWEPYLYSLHGNVPGASEKIVFDRFHIMQHMTRAVDLVRRREHRLLRAEGDESLKGSKYLWLYSAENLPEHMADRFTPLRSSHLKTARAWAIKESLRDLWSYVRRGWAEKHWKRWFFWATHSRLPPVIKVARTIERHLDNVLTYFRHRITNATSEGLNSKIQTVKQRAAGYRNAEHFKTAIYFHCGGLDLYPHAATH